MRTMKKLTVVVAVAAVCLALGLGSALAEEKAFKKYPNTVDAKFVKELVDGKVKGYLFDSRPKIKKYDRGHIPGAVSLSMSQFDKQVKLLPQDKNALIVFYCGGLKCPLSHKSAFKAEKLGYTNIKVFPEGYPAWTKAYGKGWTAREAEINAAAKKNGYKPFADLADLKLVKEVVDGKTVGLIVDARPKKKKYDQGHIPGALSIPMSQYDKLSGLLPADKTALVIFYCGGYHCPLSHKSAYNAVAAGYTNVKVFPEGYPGWKKAYGAGVAQATKAAGKKQAAAPKRQFKAGKEEGSIDWAVFKDIVANKPDSVMLIDVREPSEYKKAHFPTAVSIPSDTLEKKLPKMKVDKPIIFVCATGARSGEAYYMVDDLRKDLIGRTYYLDAELTFDKKGGYKLSKPK